MPRKTHSRRANQAAPVNAIAPDANRGGSSVNSLPAATKYPTISHAACEANGFCIHEGKQWDQTDAYAALVADEGILAVARADGRGPINKAQPGHPGSVEAPADEPELGEAGYDYTAEGLVRIERAANTCVCGCLEPVSNGRKFRQGHDQRLIGLLANIAASGRQVSWGTDTTEYTGAARSYGESYLTDAGLGKLDNAIARAKQTLTARADRTDRTTRRNRLTMDKALAKRRAADPVKPKSPQPGDEVKVKIGRHTYTARVHGTNQSGKVTAVAYATKAAPDVEKVTEKFQIV